MDIKKSHLQGVRILLFTILMIIPLLKIQSQDIQFSLWTDPVISWFSSDTRETINDGIRPGFSFGLSFDRYFAENYAFSTGIFMINSGGNLTYRDTIDISFRNFTSSLNAGEVITYHLKHISIPLGLKLRTNQIGYLTYFTNIGLDARILIGAKGDIPSQDIEGENINEEMNLFNLGFHIQGGIEYSLGGDTALAFGLGYENNFLDSTSGSGNLPDDRVKQNFIRFKIGIIF